MLPRDVAAQLKLPGASAGDFVLLDVRREDERAIAKIEPSVFIPLSELERRADELEDDEGGRDRKIVIYCHHGRRSLRAAAALRAMGFRNAVSMWGGIEEWAVSVDPKVKRY
jgi:adenylyltransferase/sulfurtransferase